MDKEYSTIDTGLKGRLAFEIIDSFFGQLSDGWGENNPRNDRYWKHCYVSLASDGKVEIHYDDQFPYFFSSAEAIKTWIANGIKKTAKFVEQDCGAAKYKWSRFNTSEVAQAVGYFGSSRIPITVQDIYFVYDWLKGRFSTMQKSYSDDMFRKLRDGIDIVAEKKTKEEAAMEDLVKRCANASSEEEKKDLLAQIYQQVLKTKANS